MKIFWQTVLQSLTDETIELFTGVCSFKYGWKRWSSLQGSCPRLYIPLWVKKSLSMTGTSMYRGDRRTFFYSQIFMREDHAHFASSMAWFKVDYIPKEGKQIRACLYPTCIRGSMDQICPGGNHLSESKWCNIVNPWSRKDPPRAILAKATTM